MARKRRNRNVQNRKNFRKIPMRRRNRNSKPRVQPSLGKLISSGVKNVVSLLPGGSALATLADVVFKSIGIGKVDVKPSSITVDEASVYTMMSVFTFGIKNFVSTAKGTTTHETSFRKVHTLYHEGRLLELEISVRPGGPQSGRAGQVLVGFEPFLTGGDASQWQDISKLGWPTERAIKQMYMSKIGPATQSFSLRFVPTPAHGYIYGPRLMNDQIGVVVVRYENYMRDTYGEFKSTDYEPSVILKGRVEYRNSYPVVTGLTPPVGLVVEDVLHDCLSNTGIQIRDSDSGAHFSFAQEGLTKTVNNNGTIKVTGTQLKSELSLESMALD